LGSIIEIDFSADKTRKSSKIDVAKVVNRRRKLGEGLIQPAQEEVVSEAVVDHSSDPIKSVDDIARMSQYFIDNKRYRDNMLFIVGINFGLRISDLLRLRFSHLIDDDFVFRKTFPILEKKTSTTRKVKKNRYITINDAVVDAVILYLEHNTCRLDNFMFRSESNRGFNVNRPMHRNSVERVLKEVGKELGLNCHIATHTLRKTFAYHQMLMSNNDPRKLLLLQKIFGHSTSAQTLDYITSEEIEEAYLGLNLGARGIYLINTQIGEAEMA